MKTVILGIGTTSIVVSDIITESHNFTIAGFVGTEAENERFEQNKIVNLYPFLGDYSILGKLKKHNINRFVVAIGDNVVRETLFYKALQHGLSPINAISKNAIIHSSVNIGVGVVISPGTILSHGVEISDNTLLDPSVVVDVNSTIGSHSYCYPGVTICGGCTIEKNVTLRANCIIEPGITVGKNQVIGAGTVVSKNVEGLFREDN